ncbi:MAG: HD domain-containing protein [Synergistaceae bacterium]|nr:HD domain-containing protein [Synergistota bacterium]NLM70366.1 HD domain-containing protein [Synergistaceae bacterium]
MTFHDAAARWLEGYINSFAEDGVLPPLMEVKRVHSLRVRDIAVKIARELGWTGELLDSAVTAALLHDTGRFPQYAGWGTYYDGASTDHGDLGESALRERFPADLARSCPRWEDILLAVRLHNKRELPGDVPPRALPIAKIVRDSDKLDVFGLVRSHVQEGRIKELLTAIDPDGGYSEALLVELGSDGRASYQNVKSLPDFLLVQLSWVLDMNYAPSFRMLREAGTLSWIAKTLPRKDSVDRFIDSVLDHASLMESA